MKYRYPMYIALIILINIASTTLFFRLDLTENKSYSLSQSSKDLVANLEEPLTIKVFLSQNLPVPYNNLERDIRDILGEYQIRANKHFNYSIDIIRKDAKNNASPETYGITPVNIQNIESDEVKVVSAYIGMTIIHGDLSEVIPAIQYNQNLEFLISNSLRKLTEKTTALLSLEENISAKLYMSPILKGMSSDLGTYYSELEKVVEEINKEYFNRISLQLVEPAQGELDELAKKYNLNLINIQNGEAQTSRAIAALLLEGNGSFSKEELIARDFFGRTVVKGIDEIEGSLRLGIEKLIGTGARIGYLTSNGTIPMDQSGETQINGLSQIISENYSLQQVDLTNGFIPGDIKTLVIAKPTVKFTDRELFILDQYLLGGNSLFVVIDQFEPDYALAQYGQEGYNQIDHGLLDLLAHHGITVGNNMVMDEASFKQTQRDSRGGVVETQIYFAPKLVKENISNHKLLNGINDLMTFKVSEVAPTYPENTDTKTLFTTSSKGWSTEVDNVTMDPSRIYPQGEQRKYSLGVVKEGEFVSYFMGKSIPQAEYSESEDTPEETELENIKELESIIEKSSKGKLLVLGSSDFISDQLLNNNFPSNVMLIQNSLDYLSDRADYIDMRSKGVFNRPMVETSPAKRNFIKTLNIAGVPLLVGLFGLLAYVLWLQRKKKIMTIFQGGNSEE